MRLKTTGERAILEAGQGGYREYRIPGILAAPDGALLLVCEARAENKGDWGDIDILALRLEKDGSLRRVLKVGESAQPQHPVPSMRTYHNPVLIPDGKKIHLIYHRNYERAFLLSSADGGSSWGESREITAAYREFPYDWNVCATGPGHGLQMRNGQLIAPVWLAHGEERDGGLSRAHWPSTAGWIYSQDHGRTWHPGQLAAGVLNANETSAVQLAGGALLLNFRNMNENRRRVLGLSENGRTLRRLWSPDELRDPMCFGGMAAGMGGVLFANCDSCEKRQDITVKYSPDGGESWAPLWQIDQQGGYVDIACAAGRVYAFYERYSYTKGIVEALVLKTGEEG